MKPKKKYKNSSVSDVSARVTVRVMKSEKETLTKNACSLGMTLNEYLKKKIEKILYE
jgi:predicted HicB family RNase H-like nuclease